jgi:hypothetical protein
MHVFIAIVVVEALEGLRVEVGTKTIHGIMIIKGWKTGI